MTTATDHKPPRQRDYTRTLRVETIANSAGGTAQVSIVAQSRIGFLNTKYYSNGMGMAQVIAKIAYGIRDLQRGKMTWSWPDFNPDPG